MSMNPLVTVVGLCYNHNRYVLETLESIRKQTYPYLQVILVDDCSTDNSVEIVEQFLREQNLTWKFVKHEKNQGIPKSLNEALSIAKGEYVKFIACDDVLLPDCVETLVNAIQPLSKEYAMVYADVLTIDESSKQFGLTPFTERGWQKETDVPSGKLFLELSKLCFIPAVSTLMRTSVLHTLRFDEKLLFEDWDMWLRISKQYLIKGIATPVVQYRIHRASMYQQKSPAYLDAELRTVQKHLGFDVDADVYLKEFIYRNSIRLYMQGGLRPLYWLWKRFLIKKNTKNLLHVLLAVAGISYKQKLAWEKKFSRAL